MKKINSIHYGSRILAVGGIIGVIFPAIFWRLSLVLNNVIFKFARNIFSV